MTSIKKMVFVSKIIFSMLGCLGISETSWAMGKSVLILKTPAVVSVAIDHSEYIVDSVQYSQALRGLLDRNWVIDDGAITVWHKADPRASSTPDLSELEKKEVNDPSALDVEEIGLFAGNPKGDINAGPYLTQLGGDQIVFALTKDDRPWGYGSERCFILYKKLIELQIPSSPAHLAAMRCGQVSQIKDRVIAPHVPGFSDLTEEGKRILDSISNQLWVNSHQVPGPAFSERMLEFQETIQFSFWQNYTQFQYDSSAATGGENVRNYPTHDIVILNMRTLSSGGVEFLVWGHRTNFVSQSLMQFSHLNSELAKTDTLDDVQSLGRETQNYYCYQGFDCSTFINVKSDSLIQTFEAEYIVLQYDPSRPKDLSIRYEGVDPRFPSLVTHYTLGNTNQE